MKDFMVPCNFQHKNNTRALHYYSSFISPLADTDYKWEKLNKAEKRSPISVGLELPTINYQLSTTTDYY